MSILEIKNLKVGPKNGNILNAVSFSLDKGDSLAVIGPNGAGKTTLFRAILGAVPYSGEIIKDKNIRIGYVPQKVDLERDLPITVGEFLSLRTHAVAAKNWDGDHSYAGALKSVGLGKEFLNTKIGELSSGELQRSLIAWAVVGHPDLLMFDEPTASVDIAGQETVYELLHKLQDEHGLTLMLISHDLSVIYKYANKVLCLNKAQTCFGPPSEVLSSAELEKLYGGGGKLYHHMHQNGN
ncbi:MAG: metal ABC transporter ATP-binding protein [bacterium]|nr:metal ABC transporter ATP-binding protein [bacterium]